MKHLILAVALLGATATTSLAQSTWPAPPTAAQNQSLKASLTAKATTFENEIKANQQAKAEAAAADLTRLMKQHVVGTRAVAEANKANYTQLMQHMTDLENYLLVFMRKSNNVMGNSADMITAVNDFITHF